MKTIANVAGIGAKEPGCTKTKIKRRKNEAIIINVSNGEVNFYSEVLSSLKASIK